MIPQRRLTRNGFSNGISYRVEACRKRLRTVRTTEAQTRPEASSAELEFEAGGLSRETTAITFSKIETGDEAGIT